MNIIVFMKQIIDTDEKISIRQHQIDSEGLNLITNPYDEYAIEEALRIRETHGGEVTVITLGDDRAVSALRHALAMGADHAMHLLDEQGIQDEWQLANLLYQAVKPLHADLILGGNLSVDNGASQVAVRVADLLGIAHIPTAIDLMIDGERIKVVRDVEGDHEMVDSSLPVLVTTQQGLNEPRYPSLPGVMKAKKKEIKTFSVTEFDLVEPLTAVAAYELPAEKQPCQILSGTLAEQAVELAQKLMKDS
jgi:electron transfer flavoprotein beta subunit